MSWVFLAGDRVYKLKKPVRFPYLDFSTLERREAACRAELSLNRRLAPDVYLDVVPLTADADGLRIAGSGAVVDWLVVMQRLDESHMLEHLIETGSLGRVQVDRLIGLLARFYGRAGSVFMSPARHLAAWRQSLAYNRKVLLDGKLGLPAGCIRRIDAVQRKFLDRRKALLRARVLDRHIVDGHGDLRPEHIFLNDPAKIIDCLEFNPSLRAVDPLDEIAFLTLELDRLGNHFASGYIRHRMRFALHDRAGEELFLFYRCHRAALRARLAIAHLLEPEPRTPEKWPRLARTYLRLAIADAARLQRSLRTPAGRSAAGSRAGGGLLARAAARPVGIRPCRAPVPDRAGTAAPCR
jgi:aminoglycoside phosphotransferase family enzyme